jgi:hypothetical protein
MTTRHYETDDEYFERSRAAFWRSSPEERLDVMRRANVLADHATPGDRVQAYDMFGDPHPAVVVGVDRREGVWMVVREGAAGVELCTLEAFTDRKDAHLVARAAEGAEAAAVKAALDLLGQPTGLGDFRHPAPPADPTELLAALARTLEEHGLTLEPEALARDESWNEASERYRDRRQLVPR